MTKQTSGDNKDEASPKRPRVRADVERNMTALLDAAVSVFATSGVDAPVREIAVKAGVGVGTLYRHFPHRADLIAAVFRHEVDACADAAPKLSSEYAPGDALDRWMQRYAAFIMTKRGLATALHSGDPAYDSLPEYFQKRFRPALGSLLEAAVEADEIRADVEPDDLLEAIASLCKPRYSSDPLHTQRMVSLLVDGLRYGARST